MAIYLVEMCIRIIARGLVKTEFSYLRDPWNCLDLVLIMLAFYGWRYVLVFRTFRFLKPYVTVSGNLNLIAIIKINSKSKRLEVVFH